MQRYRRLTVKVLPHLTLVFKEATLSAHQDIKFPVLWPTRGSFPHCNYVTSANPGHNRGQIGRCQLRLRDFQICSVEYYNKVRKSSGQGLYMYASYYIILQIKMIKYPLPPKKKRKRKKKVNFNWLILVFRCVARTYLRMHPHPYPERTHTRLPLLNSFIRKRHE